MLLPCIKITLHCRCALANGLVECWKPYSFAKIRAREIPNCQHKKNKPGVSGL
ncbi:hypothetical protein CHU_1550 [Cytophaga hutchinsonii ATCC 33406]|uniref:Uncharacterized protein n=1 Tax=Cytophaga hutchinsonii (strain ATCC 33406 / DSM 1761 / CIP 103989 / NBRC 15051 / NCIMB 9469 / D465) TaxID=269798 RepID=A0A6N4SRA7_CYTH3|nr:hypothetical protein CHU_1550 [Cytophaga hutchinsonii ATCC 33406]